MPQIGADRRGGDVGTRPGGDSGSGCGSGLSPIELVAAEVPSQPAPSLPTFYETPSQQQEPQSSVSPSMVVHSPIPSYPASSSPNRSPSPPPLTLLAQPQLQPQQQQLWQLGTHEAAMMVAPNPWLPARIQYAGLQPPRFHPPPQQPQRQPYGTQHSVAAAAPPPPRPLASPRGVSSVVPPGTTGPQVEFPAPRTTRVTTGGGGQEAETYGRARERDWRPPRPGGVPGGFGIGGGVGSGGWGISREGISAVPRLGEEWAAPEDEDDGLVVMLKARIDNLQAQLAKFVPA